MNFKKKIEVSLFLILSIVFLLYFCEYFDKSDNKLRIESFNNNFNSPNISFGESPFDSENLFQDSNFNTGIPWQFESSDNVTAQWSSIEKKANISHYSPASEMKLSSIPIVNAMHDEFFGGPKDVTDKLRIQDYDYIDLHRNDYLDVTFQEPLENGDIIILYLLNRYYDADITLYDQHSHNPPEGYGNVYYPGYIEILLNITIQGLDSPKEIFNIDISVDGMGDYVRIDMIGAYKLQPIPKKFVEKVYVNQSISVENLLNVSYNLNFTTSIAKFKNISLTTLSCKINDTIIWTNDYYSTFEYTPISLLVPDYIKSGGDFLIAFEITLSVYTTEISEFELFIDDAYFLKCPTTNLLKNSEFASIDHWRNSTSGSKYKSYYDPIEENFGFSSYQNVATLSNGWSSLNQTFYKNSTISQYQLILNYNILNNTGVESLYFEIYFNTTLILNKTDIKVTSSWEEIRLNVSQYLQLDAFYEFFLEVIVISNESENLLNFTAKIDNIYLYPIWESQINIINDVKENLFLGEETEMDLYYNISTTGDPITDAIIKVYNNDTQNEWGLDFSLTKKYQIFNEDNGNYKIAIFTIDASVNLYNISIGIYRPNFFDIFIFRQLNITGMSSNFTIVEGAYFNESYNCWLISDFNIPYVNDTTRFIKIYVWDVLTSSPLKNGYIEAYLDLNLLQWSEIYKTTKNPLDIGYYKIILDSTGLSPVYNYLDLNITVKVSIEQYATLSFSVSTLVRPIPTELDVSPIDPFYEDSKITISSIFTDKFHNVPINNANVSWIVLENSEIRGNLDFIFQGFYQKEIDLTNLNSGNFTILFTAQKEGFEISLYYKQIEVIPKWNVTANFVFSTLTIYEGNEFSISCNFSILETSEPLKDSPIHFSLNYTNTSSSDSFTRYTDAFGKIEENIYAPYSETNIIINISYRGTSEINSNYFITNITVIPKYDIEIILFTNNLPNKIIGESNLQILAKVIYKENGTAIPNIPLIFRIGNVEEIAFTNGSGIAYATLKIPSTSGVHQIIVNFTGSDYINSASTLPISIRVISPIENLMKKISIIGIYLGIIIIGIVSSYVLVKKLIINPKLREKQKQYLKLMSKFEDARNIRLLMIIEKDSGVPIYSTQISEIPLDPILISGFLQAITSFGSSLKFSKEKDPEKNLNELSFYHFRVIVEQEGYVSIALLLLRTPSQTIKQNLKSFVEELNFSFRNMFENWSGEAIDNKLVDPLINKYFQISYSYAHILNKNNIKEDQTFNKWEKIVIKEFQSESLKEGYYLDKFSSDFAQILYPGKEYELLKAILNLKDRQILIPLIPKLSMN
ncbi:MAG: hypothetical protein ACFE91_05240 [Promethearchaeota archaeon]